MDILIVLLCILGFTLIELLPPVNGEMETDCNTRPGSFPKAAVFSQPTFPFRTDKLTWDECMAYSNVTDGSRCNPAGLQQFCNRTVPDEFSLYPMSRTFLAVECGQSTRPLLASVTKKVSTVSPNRAITINLNERNDTLLDPVHPDVVEPVRQQLIELNIGYCATRTIMSKVYALGQLPYVVRLSIALCKNMIVKKKDFQNVQQLRVFYLFQSTIGAMEPYTFTDLVHLQNLALESGLYLRMKNRDEDGGSPFFRMTDEESQDIRRLHCDCLFAWFRNFLQEKPYLLASRTRGEIFSIGNYMSDYVFANNADGTQSMFYVDCAKNLSINNINAGPLFSYNTQCIKKKC
ncbi:uncharacterized protein LOC129599308 [Paramacrobiotus metropolitanus]|uniref:uncharacterized protein LOC129599308 n=1 Tax=Paramacrobiotus metropolitanus TaxID=2943436 RepID=UPI002445D47F|nr:uncharacterized protein LOC129599308 [Paramacrobiotus metropolitanus]